MRKSRATGRSKEIDQGVVGKMRDFLLANPIIPVVVIDDLADAVPLAEAGLWGVAHS